MPYRAPTKIRMLEIHLAGNTVGVYPGYMPLEVPASLEYWDPLTGLNTKPLVFPVSTGEGDIQTATTRWADTLEVIGNHDLNAPLRLLAGIQPQFDIGCFEIRPWLIGKAPASPKLFVDVPADD
jgi:hypothetical protein